MKDLMRIITDNLIISKIPIVNDFYSIYKQYKEEKTQRNQELFLKELETRLTNLEFKYDQIVAYLNSNEFKKVFNFVLFENVIENHIEEKIVYCANGISTSIENELSLDKIIQYYKDLDYLMKIDIDELINFANDESYKINEISKERLFSRGLLRNNLYEETQNALESLAYSARYAMMEKQWELMSLDDIELTHSISEWGKSFINFFKMKTTQENSIETY
ncbi:hypothetical protein KHQ81_06335 [Mycoplasmatota bacterium]|nr:hypothetical protein KHQ81_06335 [Mycoplasmatota bacterium]